LPYKFVPFAVVICTGRTAAIKQEASYVTVRYALAILMFKVFEFFYTLLGSCFSV